MKLNKFIILFFTKAMLLYVAWYFVYEQWIMKVGWLDDIVIGSLVDFSLVLLKVMGYSTFVYHHTFGIDGSNGVFIGLACNGVDLMALFAGFVLIFKGSWKDKLWFIPLGVFVIYLLNLLRVVSLTIIAKYVPETLDFNHKYTFTLLMYFIVFLGWMLWVNKFSNSSMSK